MPDADGLEERVRPMVAQNFLEPFALKNHFLVPTEKEKQDVLVHHPSMAHAAFSWPRRDRPTWLVGGSLLSDPHALPFQMSAGSIQGPASFAKRTA